MNAVMSQLRNLVIKELDPTFFRMDGQSIAYWLQEIPLLEMKLFKRMQEEMLGILDNGLLERHLKQVQYDCMYLSEVLSKYKKVNPMALGLYQKTAHFLEEVLMHMDAHYSGFLTMQNKSVRIAEKPDHKIRVLFSVDALAYFFKLLHRVGALDAGPVTQLLVSISQNFVTPGLGKGEISLGGLTTRYKQVVQTTAEKVRVLLVRMLKCLDEEFQSR